MVENGVATVMGKTSFSIEKWVKFGTWMRVYEPGKWGAIDFVIWKLLSFERGCGWLLGPNIVSFDATMKMRPKVFLAPQ